MFYQKARTLAEYVLLCLDRHVTHPFLAEIEGRTITYGQAREQVRALWQLFRRYGIRPGDHIALLGQNSINWSLVYLATVTYGAVIVPILPDFTPPAVQHILQISDSKALFVASSLLDRVEGVKFPQLERSFLLEDFRTIDLRAIPDFMKRIRKQVDLLREKASAYFDGWRALRPKEPRPEDLAAVVYTSGTTGMSKGVMLTQSNLVENIKSAVVFVQISPDDRFLSLLPLAHTYECTCGFLGPMMGGASFHYLQGKPSPKVLLPAFQKVRPTIVFSVPLIIEKIYRKQVMPKIEGSLPLRWLSRWPAIRRALYRKAVRKLQVAFGGALRQMGLGGAAIPAEVERFLIEGRFPYFVGYGMTECSPLIAGCELGRTRRGSCGRPIPQTEVRISPTGTDSKIGEVQVRGPQVSPGYYKNAEATRDLFTADGWLKTGDLGYLDADSYLFLIGRSKNVIIGPSGENIYPEEIEHLINQSSHVQESLVLQREGRLVALILPDYEQLQLEMNLATKTEAEAKMMIRTTIDRVIADANRSLPGFSRVSSFTLTDSEFEKTPTNKIKRYLYG